MRRVTGILRAPQAPAKQSDPPAPSGAAVAGRPPGRARARILVALGALALFAVLLPATAEAATGVISGTVTNANTKAGIEGARVCATPEAGGAKECVEANAKGEYKISGLAEGKYKVDFTGETCYKGFCSPEYSSKTESAVQVESGKTKEVNAALTPERGRISGTVTSGGSPLTGAEVCVDLFDCTSTNANGEYSVGDLLPGSSNVVYFHPTFECKAICESTANYIPQYYNGQLKEEAANRVKVEAGYNTTGINAEMQVGGQISGKVTNAANNQAIANLKVCAFSTATNKQGVREAIEEFFEEFDVGKECALTSSSGEYTIHALATQDYEVSFTGAVCVEEKPHERKCTHPYVDQYYSGLVPVTAPDTTSGVNAGLLEVTSSKPASTAAPAVTGSASAGGVLGCSQGSWSNNPSSFTYRWLRNGSAIAGQTTNSYTVQSADLGTGISCEVTATNAAGSTGAVSNTLQIPKPAPGVAVLVKMKIKGSTVSITLRCTGASACTGVLKLLVRIVKHKHASSTSIASTASFTIELGKSATLRVRLTRQGRMLLTRAGRKGLAVQIAGTGVKAVKSVLR